MGRKIPGRKHHGVKDPEKQRAERLKSIKHKINAPPSNPDEQQVPRSLQRLVELKAKVKNGDFNRKKRKKNNKVASKFQIASKEFQQRPNESDREFLYRVNRRCETVKREAAFEEKFGVEIKYDEEGDVASINKRPKDPVQVMVKQARQEKKKAKNQAKDGEIKLTKSQKRRIKIMEKKKKKMGDNVDEFKKFQDKVKFGEQVHAPPSLSLPKKVAKTNIAPRPGQKNLLLKSMLNSKKTSNKVIDRTGKRKDLPNALRRQLDKQQQEIVEAYKLLKGKKRENK